MDRRIYAPARSLRPVLAALIFGLVLTAAAGTGHAAADNVVILEGGFGSVGTPAEIGSDRAFVGGFVVRDRGLSEPGARDSKLRNASRTVRALLAKPAEGVEVEVEVGGRTYHAHTDGRGHFSVELDAAHLRDLGTGAHQVAARIAGQAKPDLGRGKVHLYRYDQDVVISDIDDTAVVTEAHKRVRMTVRYFSRNASNAKAVDGSVVDFYRGLQDNGIGLVFVTSRFSGLLARTQRETRGLGLPQATILTKPLRGRSLTAHTDYKLGQIERIHRYLPHASLHLIGDSGESDSEVFHRAMKRFDNIVAAYVRRVPGVDGRRLYGEQRVFDDFSQLRIGRRRHRFDSDSKLRDTGGATRARFDPTRLRDLGKPPKRRDLGHHRGQDLRVRRRKSTGPGGRGKSPRRHAN